MPSLAGIVGVIVTFVVLSVASGLGKVAWKAIGELRRVAIVNAGQSWGCPSLSDRSACTGYDPVRYR